MSGFQKGQLVVHCRDGLARVNDTTIMGDKQYFIVHLLKGDSDNIYVPYDRASSIIRNLMTKEEANEVIQYMKTVELEYNSNTKQRRDSLKRRLVSGNINDVAFLFKQLYFYKAKNENGTIKFGPVDLDMLNFANDNLLDEFAIVYGIDRNVIGPYIYDQLSR